MLERQLTLEREHMQRVLEQEREAVRQEVVDALAARGLEEQPGLEEPYEEFTETSPAPDVDAADEDTSPSPEQHDAKGNVDASDIDSDDADCSTPPEEPWAPTSEPEPHQSMPASYNLTLAPPPSRPSHAAEYNINWSWWLGVTCVDEESRPASRRVFTL